MFTRTNLVIEYEDLAREQRQLYDKNITLRNLTGLDNLAGSEFFNLTNYELDMLMQWSFHIRWLTQYWYRFYI